MYYTYCKTRSFSWNDKLYVSRDCIFTDPWFYPSLSNLITSLKITRNRVQYLYHNIKPSVSNQNLLEWLDQELLAWENVFICLQILVGMIQCHKTLFNLWSTALIKVNFFKKSWVQNILHKHPLSSMPYLNIMQLYYIEHNHYLYLHLWLPNKGAHHNFSSNTYSIYCHSCFKIIYTTQD